MNMNAKTKRMKRGTAMLLSLIHILVERALSEALSDAEGREKEVEQ